MLTQWGRVTHVWVGNLTIIGSDNGLSPGWRQAIIWTNAGILLIGPLVTNFNEILVRIQTFSLKKNAINNVVCEMASILSRPQCVKVVQHVRVACKGLIPTIGSMYWIIEHGVPKEHHLCSILLMAILHAHFSFALKQWEKKWD